jgi:hypothetical protein
MGGSAPDEPFELMVDVGELRSDGSNASVHLDVELVRTPGMVARNGLNRRLLSTGVTVPIGQTVVLGTSATDNGKRALILTVRPQLAPTRK